MTLRRFPSGQSGFSPDEMTLRSFSSDKNHNPPDGRPMRVVHQNHFGSQCATERVYRYSPAKVKLKKSHFGKPPLTECVLRHPPCQSELAEAPTTFCGTHESPSKTKATGRSYARAKMPDSPRASNTPRGQCHPRLSGGNHFARNGRVRPRGVFCWRATKACHEVEKHLLISGAVETLPEGVLAEGVLYFRTPSGRTLTRTL